MRQRRFDGGRIAVLGERDVEGLAFAELRLYHLFKRDGAHVAGAIDNLLVVDERAETEVLGVHIGAEIIAENFLQRLIAELALDGEGVLLREHEVALVAVRSLVVLTIGVALGTLVAVPEAPGDALRHHVIFGHRVAMLVVLLLALIV